MIVYGVALHHFCVAWFDKDKAFCIILIRKLAAFCRIEIFSLLYIPYVQEKRQSHMNRIEEFSLRHTIRSCKCKRSHMTGFQMARSGLHMPLLTMQARKHPPSCIGLLISEQPVFCMYPILRVLAPGRPNVSMGCSTVVHSHFCSEQHQWAPSASAWWVFWTRSSLLLESILPNFTSWIAAWSYLRPSPSVCSAVTQDLFTPRQIFACHQCDRFLQTGIIISFLCL